MKLEASDKYSEGNKSWSCDTDWEAAEKGWMSYTFHMPEGLLKKMVVELRLKQKAASPGNNQGQSIARSGNRENKGRAGVNWCIQQTERTLVCLACTSRERVPHPEWPWDPGLHTTEGSWKSILLQFPGASLGAVSGQRTTQSSLQNRFSCCLFYKACLSQVQNVWSFLSCPGPLEVKAEQIAKRSMIFFPLVLSQIICQQICPFWGPL